MAAKRLERRASRQIVKLTRSGTLTCVGKAHFARPFRIGVVQPQSGHYSAHVLSRGKKEAMTQAIGTTPVLEGATNVGSTV